MFNNVVEIADLFFRNIVKEGDVCIDATCGNGNDTLFLSTLVKEKGKVYAFDVQKEAIENAKALIGEHERNNVEFFLSSHENVAALVKDRIDFTVFNLGYLPRSDKEIVTKAQSTIRALESILHMTKVGGIILLCAYLGHEGGMEEYLSLKEYLMTLDVKKVNVVEIAHPVRHKDAPRIVILEKIRED